jgi:AraC-like DNA-binding protein
VPPMQYVMDWRMALAKAMLRRDTPPLEAVAAAIGYQSASAFSTAFRREVGSPPSHFRSHHNRLTVSQPQGAASGVQAQRRHHYMRDGALGSAKRRSCKSPPTMCGKQ